MLLVSGIMGDEVWLSEFQKVDVWLISAVCQPYINRSGMADNCLTFSHEIKESKLQQNLKCSSTTSDISKQTTENTTDERNMMKM